jgi:deoxyribonuclease (pyrimidine dimer)
MVRINLVHPKKLSDQHLIAEYNEILMLFGYVKKYPSAENIPHDYSLGKGHIKFFKNKLIYLKKRHEIIKKEMKKRNFETNKALILSSFPKHLHNDWSPKRKDFDVIIERIVWKINKKPQYYRYYGIKKSKTFFHKLLRS